MYLLNYRPYEDYTLIIYFRNKNSHDQRRICECQESIKRSIVSIENDKYLIVSNDTGCQIAKIGTGYLGTIKGYVYAKSKCLEPGLIAEINGVLIHRPFKLDVNLEAFGYVINVDTLERQNQISQPLHFPIMRGEAKTTAILKYRDELIWFRQVTADVEILDYFPQAHISIVDFCKLENESSVKIYQRKILLKNPESADKVTKVMELIASPKTQTNDTDIPVKFPADSNSTSSGLRTTILQESAMVCDDRFFSILTPNPDSRGKLSKSLGTAFSFDLINATLQSQNEMTFELSSLPLSLPKGYSISNSSIIYSPHSHKFWSLAYNRIDEFYGPPGTEPGPYLRQKLFSCSTETFEENLIFKLMEHAAIQTMKSRDDISLNKSTKQNLVDITTKIIDNNLSLSRIILEILSKISYIEEDFFAEINIFLRKMLHSQNCDRNMTKQILTLLIKHSTEPMTQTILSLLKIDLPALVQDVVRKYYLNEAINQMEHDDEQALHLLEEIEKEFEASIQETLSLIVDCKKLELKNSKHVPTLVKIICNIGDNATQNKNSNFFVTLSQLSFKYHKMLIEKLFNLEKKPQINTFNSILSMSILGPTFMGALFCFIMNVKDAKEALSGHINELFCLLAKLFTMQDPFKEEKNLERSLPWIISKNVSSPHPIKEGYKYQETVKFPGVRCLYLIFNERCSTMTDQDKLSIYSGANVGCKKILEFSGNHRTTKRIGHKPWPKKPILLMGDTVTFDFEAKGRQDFDKDLSWGFEIAIGHCPNDLFDPLKMNVLQSTLITIAPILKELLYNEFLGSSQSQEEQRCSHLLTTKILQKCHWKESKVEQLFQIYNTNPQENLIPPLSTISSKTIAQLRALSGIGLPIMRESTKRIIQPNLLEEAIVSAVVKHMALNDTINSYMQDQDPNTPDGCLLSDIMMDVYLRIASLIRKLQSIAEIEAKWNDEIINLKEGVISLKDVFFVDYLHHEVRSRDLSLLLFLKNVKEDNPNKAVQDLKSILEREAHDTIETSKTISQTAILTKEIFNRLDLLLKVETENNINPNIESQMMTTSLQNWPQSKSLKRQQSSDLEKSLDDSILQINKLHCSISRLKQSRSIIETSTIAPLDLHSNPEIVVNDLFDFIGNNPEKSVSSSEFLKAISQRLQRCKKRLHALEMINSLMQSIEKLPITSKYIMYSLSECLSLGLRFNDLLCSQVVSNSVMDYYTNLLMKIIDFEENNLTDSNMAILGFISAAPYERIEGKCLARSGLLTLLDKLTDNQDVILSDPDSVQLTGTFSWICFKLISRRCVGWEIKQENDTDLELNDLEKQISKLLSNHLNQATSCGHSSYKFEAVYECLNLLKDLTSTKLGKGTLCQSECMSNMFHFLCDPYLSPQATQTVISLIQIALPFMTFSQVQDIKLPNKMNKSNDLKIIQIILDRLSYFTFPLENTKDHVKKMSNVQNLDTLDQSQPQIDDGAMQALFLHKRPDQSGHELIQQLLNASGDVGIFSAMGSDSMEKIIKIDKDINQHNCAEVLLGEATRILRTANKMANIGFVVSISAPNQFHDSSSGWKHRAVQICNQRNSAVAQNSPSRPFISHNVANKLAAELIILIHRLVSGIAGEKWLAATRACIVDTFDNLPEFLEVCKNLTKDVKNEDLKLLYDGQKMIAALALLGGFYETLKPGCAVKLKESKSNEYCDSIVKYVNRDSASAVVIANNHLTQEQIELNVPLRKLKLEDNLEETSQILLVKAAEDIVPYLQTFLLPTDDGTEPLCFPLPINSSNSQVNAFARLAAEIRTRSCHVLALHMREEQFARKFLEQSCQSVDMMKYFAKDIQPSDKLCCTEFICANYRGKFKDQIKQITEGNLPSVVKDETENHWNTMQLFPPVKNVIFMHNLTGITYLGTPITSIGLPRGVLIQSVQALPITPDPVFFIINILSLGENTSDTGAPTISIGLSPQNARKEGAWNHAEGAIVLHSNGRIVHYEGSNLLSWHSTRVDHLLSPGDEVKISWIPTNESIGKVQFDVNGIQIGNAIENISGGLLPTAHIQQQGVRINASFSSGGSCVMTQSSEDTVDKLPNRECEKTTLSVGGHRRQLPQLCRQAIRIKPSEIYNFKSSNFKLELNGYSRISTGYKSVLLQDTEWVEEDDDDEFDEMVDEREDDVNALLVKSWEEKVFPSIRRRFRNESERRDGLDQIKGALSLGMIDIAKQTVEFLYEENGGIPSDLKLPDLDDVKKDLSTLSVDKLKSRMIVSINEHDQQPLFSCKQQIKTFGLEGEIIRVDRVNELVEVETYLEADGIIVRFWYPVDALKKSNIEHNSPKSKSRSLATLQSELMNMEFILSRLYCREAYLGLLQWANDENFNLVSTDESNIELNATLMSNVLLLQDWDVENLLYIMDSLSSTCHCSLVELGCEESICSTNVKEMSPSLPQKLLKSNYQYFLSAMVDIFIKLSSNNSALVQELGLEILSSLREFDTKILQEQLDINDVSVLASTIHFPYSSCVVSSIKFEKEITKYPDSLKVIVQPLEYESKTKNMQHSLNYLLKYPFQVKGGKNIKNREFPSVIYSTNVLRIYHGGASDSNIQLQLDGISNKFILALVFTDILTSEPAKHLFPSRMYSEALEQLSSMILKFPLSPIVKTSIFYSIADLVQTMTSMSLNIGLKMTERLFEKILQEFSFLNDCEMRCQGAKNLHSFYFQAITELCYQLQPLAQNLSLEIPPSLDQLCKAMTILKSLKTKIDFPKNFLRSMTIDNSNNIAGRYLVICGIPKLMAPHEIFHALKKAFLTLNGLQITEIFCGDGNVIENNKSTGCIVIQIQTCFMQTEAKDIITKISAFHQKSNLDLHQETGTVTPLIVSKLKDDLTCEEKSCEPFWIDYLKSKLLDHQCLNSKVTDALKKIIHGSLRDSSRDYIKFADLLIKKQNSFLAFLNGTKDRPATDIRDDLREFFEPIKVTIFQLMPSIKGIFF